MAIIDIIKYEGDNSTFVWKHDCEDFNTRSQLIVHETQEAVFFKDGKAMDLFEAGKYSLSTKNIPFLSKFINIPTGGVSRFHCEVYFVNKTEQMAIKWGTDSKVQYIEPTYKFPISIGACGEMSISVSDSKKLLVKLVGTEALFDRNSFMTYFRAILMTKAKTYIAQEMKAGAINIFEIDEHLDDFSNAIKAKLIEDFAEYGIALNKFWVTNVLKPDGDAQYERFKDLHFRQYADIAEAELQQKVGVIEQQTKAQQMVIEAQGIAQKRATEGYTYQQERGFDVAEGAVKNTATGSFSNMGIGLGMMAGVGSVVGGTVNEAMKGAFAGTNMSTAPTMYCDQCGAPITAGAAFCENCGAPQTSSDQCAKCGYKFTKPGKFCPNCGAKRGE